MTRTTRRFVPWRFAVPAAIAAATVGAVTFGPTAFADDSHPGLPEQTADQLVAKVAAARADALTGTVRIDTDLGLPALPGKAGGNGPQALLSGTNRLQVALDGPDRQRIGLMSDLAEYNVIHNGRDVWTYDSRAHAVTHGTVDRGRPDVASLVPTTPQDVARQLLDLVGPTTDVRADGTGRVAGHDVYKLRFAPRAQGSLIAAATVFVDAKTGVPLRVTVDTVKGGKPAIDIGFEQISYDKPAAGTFDFKPPAGAQVKEVAPNEARPQAPGTPSTPAAPTGGHADPGLLGEGWATVVELPAGGDAKDATRLLGKLGKPVPGGTLINTRLVNVLSTDSGRVFAGAVDADTLQRIAAQR
ncbi:outer membrane lipoprotein carrier protein LolA [Embleya sp. NPDC050493]|uniref:outer membrane lipoprotein carrier protein LolA n=1 Tax=Embleya sp. NPDC050493 TaxID=3363989 RepID=UPI0037880F70